MFLREKEILFKARQDSDYLNQLLKSEEMKKFINHAIKAYTKSPARFMAVNRVEWDDLLQAAYIGVFKAINNLNLNLSPNEWVRYTYLKIQGELRYFSRSNDSNMIVISQRIREMYPKYIQFFGIYWNNNDRDPTIEDTMKYFNISKDDAFDLVYGMQDIIYNDTNLKMSSGIKKMNVVDIYESKSKNSSVENSVINKIMVEMFLNRVNTIQRKILYLFYFKGLNKSEISKIVGCSNSMITKHINTAFNIIQNS